MIETNPIYSVYTNVSVTFCSDS